MFVNAARAVSLLQTKSVSPTVSGKERASAALTCKRSGAQCCVIAASVVTDVVDHKAKCQLVTNLNRCKVFACKALETEYSREQW